MNTLLLAVEKPPFSGAAVSGLHPFPTSEFLAKTIPLWPRPTTKGDEIAIFESPIEYRLDSGNTPAQDAMLATAAELSAALLLPHEGQKVEFWANRMSLEGSGITGWFEGGRFWSHDKADHWSCSEIVTWQAWQDKVEPSWWDLMTPAEGQKLAFWTSGMSRDGDGIQGVFKGGLFWSRDLADHWSKGEVVWWEAR